MDPWGPARHDGPESAVVDTSAAVSIGAEVPTGVPTARKTRDFSRNHAVRQSGRRVKTPCKSIGSWPREESNLFQPSTTSAVSTRSG